MAFTENQAGLVGPCGGCGINIEAPLPFQSKSIPVGISSSESEELERRRAEEPSLGKLITPQGNFVALRGEYIRFGSSINCDVVIADCYGVSDEQFRLAEDDDRHILVNLAPNENQTRVNAMAVCERPLKDQDVIFAGQLRLTYRAPTIGKEEQKVKETNRQSYARAAIIGAIALLLVFVIADFAGSPTPERKKTPERSAPIVMPGKEPRKPTPPPVRTVPPSQPLPPQNAVAAAYPTVSPGYTPPGVGPNDNSLPYNVVAAPDRQMVQNVRRSQVHQASFDHVTLYEESVVNHYEQVLVDAYLANGHRSWKWDREAITALNLFARIYTGEGVAFSRSDFAALKRAVTHCIQAGCRDAAILHAKERIQSTEYGLIAKAGDPSPSPTLDEQVLAAYPAEVRAPSYLHKMKMSAGSEDKKSKEAIMAELIDSTAEWNVNTNDPYLSTVYWDHVEQATIAAVNVMEGKTKSVVNRFDTSFKMHSVPQEVRDVFRTAVPVWLAWNDRAEKPDDEDGDLAELGLARNRLEQFWDNGLQMPIVPELMLKVALMSGEKELFSLWYDRSIMLNPEDPTPYRLKAEFLSPSNYGDVAELTAFADSLIDEMDSPNLPWLGLEVYAKLNGMIDNDFAKRTEIWKRVSSTFDTFFKRYPDAHFRKAQRAAISWELGYEEEAREQLEETGLDYAAFTINFKPELLGEESPHEQMMKDVEEAEFRNRLEGAILGGGKRG